MLAARAAHPIEDRPRLTHFASAPAASTSASRTVASIIASASRDRKPGAQAAKWAAPGRLFAVA